MSLTEFSPGYLENPGKVFVPTKYQTVGKPLLDCVLVIMSLPVLIPLVLTLAAIIMLDGGNPFFVQERVGRNGRVFRLVKLRTMVVNSEETLAQYLAANPTAAQEWSTNQKLRNDPRITVTGRVLRKTSLDELPQLFNVLLGQMSLVGPRPMMPCQKALYPGSSYYRLKPGVTGFWQISKRNAAEFWQRAEFDASYEREIGLGTDLKVLLKTIGVVVRATGY